MKRIFLVITLFGAMALNASAQYIVGNPQWKWDTVVLFGAQNELKARYLQLCDVNGNVLEQLVQTRLLSAWSDKTKITMTYMGGRIAYTTTAAWSGSAWTDVVRLTPGYDGMGRITSELIEQNKLNGWSNYRLRHYTYGPQNRKLQMLQEKWSGGTWKNDTKTDYGYDDNGFQDTVTSQYSETGEGWLNGMRLIYTCDVNGNWLEALLESFETGTWTGGHKIIYTNDTRGNIEYETYATLTGNAWVNEFRRVYTYDSGDNAITGKNETFTDMQWVPEVTSSYMYYKKDFLLVIDEDHYRFEASYRNFPMGIGENPIRMLTLYPNPADESFRIGGLPENTRQTVVGLYDAAGVMVQGISVPLNGTVSTAGLDNGLYIIKAAAGSEVFTGKLLISHP